MVSIIIPTYNRAHLITRAINSVLNQSIKEWELIIVDDGSTDNTSEIIKPFLSDERIKYIQKENTGAAHSRNVGVENSTFEWISFLDSDDEAKTNWLSEVSELIINSDVRLISCGCEKFDERGDFIERKLPKRNRNLFGEVVYLMIGGVFFLRKIDFLAIKGYDRDLKSGQHTELSFRLIPFLQKRNDKILVVDKALVKIHIHSGERIRTNPKLKYEGALYSLKKHKDFLSKRRKAKSKYEAVVGVNAFKLKYYRKSFFYLIKSFFTKPSFTSFLRISKYATKVIFLIK